MASKCGCSGNSCSCKVIAGRGVKVRGNGAQNNPIVIDAYPMSLSGSVTSTVTTVVSGIGTASDPWVVTADVLDTGVGDKWKLWSGSQAAYNAIATKDNQTLYAITS